MLQNTDKAPVKYELIKQQPNEEYIPLRSEVIWAEELDAYYEKESGLLFGKREIEESGNWKPV